MFKKGCWFCKINKETGTSVGKINDETLGLMVAHRKDGCLVIAKRGEHIEFPVAYCFCCGKKFK